MKDMQRFYLVLKPAHPFPDDPTPPPVPAFRVLAAKYGLTLPVKLLLAPSPEAADRFRDRYGLRQHFLPPVPAAGGPDYSGDCTASAQVDSAGTVAPADAASPGIWRREVEDFQTRVRDSLADPRNLKPITHIVGFDDSKRKVGLRWYYNSGTDVETIATTYGGVLDVPVDGCAVLAVGPAGAVLCAELSEGPIAVTASVKLVQRMPATQGNHGTQPHD